MCKGILTLHDVESGDAVKGLWFHHERPWIVAGLSSGMIQIWNYNTKALLNEFQGHNGSVQSVQFNVSCPLIVSGGCDGKIKLWDYDDNCSLRSTFALEGHIESVNDVQFHLELPWIVSASDDCTVRLWNWMSRRCIAVLTNHSGAVTSASFHPRKDLVLSSSMDRTLCIWDVSGLRGNSVSCVDGIEKSRIGAFLSRLSKKRDGVRLKRVLEGHVSGVVRAIFHPDLPIIVSASDDCSVYWWKMDETNGYSNHKTIHHQAKQVSRLAYSKKLNSVMSTPDDKMIFLFDASARPGRQNAEFYVPQNICLNLCSHPTRELFAVGHTTGMTVFRNTRESPAFSEFNNILYYVKDKFLWSYDYLRKEDAHIVLGPIDDLPPDATFVPIIGTLSCSPQGDAALVCFNSEGYRLVLLNPNRSDKSKKHAIAAKGNGLATVFVAPDRYAVLIRSGSTKEKILSVRNLANEVVSECVLPGDIVGISSYAGLGNHLLCKATDRVVMFDLQQRVIVSELSISSVCNVFWMGGDGKAVVAALVGKYFITMVNQKLQRLWTFDEVNMIESGMWDLENYGVFIYKTWRRIRYFLINGAIGTIMEYKEPLFITRVSGSTIYGLDEDGEVRIIHVDATKHIMKSSIFNKDYMKQCCLCLC